MPNRLLRDWTNSDKIRDISVHAERFFVRLIMKVDDYGCFWADPMRLKANLFPLLLDSVRDADVSRWMAECQKAGLIVIYEESSKRYLQILDFGQRLRQKTQKFPMPADGCQLTDIRPPEVRREVEEEVEEKGIPTHEFSHDHFHSTKNKKEKKENSPGAEILYSIEHCLTVAMNDDRWVRDNNATVDKLILFNKFLSGQGIYTKNPMDYKKHYYNWKQKNKNGTHQQSPAKSSVRKSAGAEQLLASLKTDIAGFTGPGSKGN